MKNTSRTTTITDQTLKQNLKQDSSSIDLTDVSIISVGLTRYPHPHHRMLTDDEEEDIEVIDLSCTIDNELFILGRNKR